MLQVLLMVLQHLNRLLLQAVSFQSHQRGLQWMLELLPRVALLVVMLVCQMRNLLSQACSAAAVLVSGRKRMRMYHSHQQQAVTPQGPVYRMRMPC